MSAQMADTTNGVLTVKITGRPTQPELPWLSAEG